MKKQILTIFASLILLGSLGLVLGETSYCCEKTVSGAWCQNEPQDQCDPGFNSAPTSCDSTSYCKVGCCFDQNTGDCSKNTPQKACSEDGGFWDASESCDIAQCSLGCCLLGDQAAFVTQTKCNQLSGLYGLDNEFRTDLTNEVQCIANTIADIEGACVFEEEFTKTCKFMTQKECNDLSSAPESSEGILSLFGSEDEEEEQSLGVEVKFYKDTLCTDSSLGTNCARTEKTTCVDGEDEVYFLDSCGNVANIYDASKKDDENYWADKKEKFESCNPSESNADSSSCGNCDYFLGSTCKDFQRGVNRVRPLVGDNICRNLACEWKGEEYSHGETWCADSSGIKDGLPGSRAFRMVCYNGEVSVEPCADFRQETCIQDSIGDFSTAACRVNRWQTCIAQANQKDCENTDRRDCRWTDNQDASFKCVPLDPPGFDFWQAESESTSLCSKATTECTVVFEKGLTGGKECIENCECLDSSWTSKMNNLCIAIGDCGSTTNYLGAQGYN